MKKVITYGTFDLLHYGHVNLLKRARQLGDYLIVALSTDEFNTNKKNKETYFNYDYRKQLLEAIRYVDLVIPEETWEQKLSDISDYEINIFAIGDDWKGKFDYLKDKCEVIYLPRTEEISTTKIKEDLNKSIKERMIKYSIIIPTCSKPLVERCLEYISKINKPKYDYEVLVVHNTTKEDIKSVTDEYNNKIPNLKYFYEDNYGQMHSRHRGAKEAQGEILCYLDDDSFVDKNWLIAIEDTFNNKDVVLAGGNNLPLYESIPPKWLKYFWEKEKYGKWLGQLSLINFHEKNMKLPAWFAFGCNFIIKKDIFYKFGGTNPDVVPKEKQRFQGDGETALSIKLNNNGYFLNFNPKIKIHHFVPTGRMTLEYFQKRAFYQGVCDSFSKIRKENGFIYYNIVSKDNKSMILLKKIKIILNNLIKIEKKIIYKEYKKYIDINKKYEKSYKDGFDFHQKEVKNDPELLKWVLKENYLE